ncbi:MAG: hypothetical protein LUG18_02625 [Candidatus Azobacteroides sp.]|nr:hypothetical protein [Candidatus Azobacteroides sp.]
MKATYCPVCVVFLMVLLTGTACNNNHCQRSKNGHILILPDGDMDVRMYPVIIKKETDTTYLQYRSARYKGTIEEFRTDRVFEYSVDNHTFCQMENYFNTHNTHIYHKKTSPYTEFKISINDGEGYESYFLVTREEAEIFFYGLSEFLEEDTNLYNHLRYKKESSENLIEYK